MCGAILVRTVLFIMVRLVCRKQFLGKITQKYINLSQLLSERRLKIVEIRKLNNMLICQQANVPIIKQYYKITLKQYVLLNHYRINMLAHWLIRLLAHWQKICTFVEQKDFEIVSIA